MARTSRNGQKLQASYRALQNDLSAVVEDLEKMASSGRDVGLDKAKEQLDSIQDQIESLLSEAGRRTEEKADEMRKTVADYPMASLGAAFALGMAAASFLGGRR